MRTSPLTGMPETIIPVKIVAAYAIVSSVWIFGSDTILGYLIHDPSIITKLSVVKGLGFVLVTAALLYFMIQRNVRRLREAEGRYRQIFNNANDAICLFDVTPQQQFRLIAMNHAWEEMLGLTETQTRGRLTDDYLSPEGAEIANRFLRHCIKTGKPARYEGEITLAAGTFHLSSTLVPIRDPQGRIVRIIGITRDTTEHKRTEQQRQALQEQLAQVQKMESIGRLAGGIAHDFNNALSPIIGYTTPLADEIPPDDSRHEYLAPILHAAEHARNLTRRLLAFGRKEMLELKTIDLRQDVAEFRKLLRHTIREDITIDLRTPPTLKAVRADIGQIEQIIMNLAVNAQDAMPNGGIFSITLEDAAITHANPSQPAAPPPGNYVLLTITDNGVGMAPETLARAFEPFFTTKEPGKGTGLGLSMVYGIVKQHEGYIDLESTPGHGTTFRIHIPATNDTPVASRAKEPAPSPTPPPSQTILVVEDNDAVRDLTAAVLKHEGYRVHTAEHPSACIEFLERSDDPIHLLLTDIVMPDMNGQELYKAIANRRPAIKVLYMSGYSGETEIPLGPRTHFIAKPFKPQALVAKIREALAS